MNKITMKKAKKIASENAKKITKLYDEPIETEHDDGTITIRYPTKRELKEINDRCEAVLLEIICNLFEITK